MWWIRYYRNGKRHEESSGSTKETDAKSLLRVREGDIERGIAITPKVGRIRFEEAVKDVLNRRIGGCRISAVAVLRPIALRNLTSLTPDEFLVGQTVRRVSTLGACGGSVALSRLPVILHMRIRRTLVARG